MEDKCLTFTTKSRWIKCIILQRLYITAPGLSHISSSYIFDSHVILSVAVESWLWQSLAAISSTFWMKSPTACSALTAADASEHTWSLCKPCSRQFWSTTMALLVSKSSWLPSWGTALSFSFCLSSCSPVGVAASGLSLIPAWFWALLSRPKKLFLTT